MNHALAAVISTDHKSLLEEFGKIQGWAYSENEFSVQLSSDGAEPVTHYGLCHIITNNTLTTWNALKANPNLIQEMDGFDRNEVIAAINNLEFRYTLNSPQNRTELFFSLLNELNLQQITFSEEGGF